MALSHERGACAYIFLAARCVYQGAEDRPRAFVIFYGTFRVLLHCQDEVIGRYSL